MADASETPQLNALNKHSRKSRSTFVSRTARTRRFTPYIKTPRSRKSVAKQHVGDASRKERQDMPLKRFAKKTWHVYQVTPLYQFKQDAASLKRYSSQLSSYLQSEAQKGFGFATAEDIGAHAMFEKIPSLVDAEGTAQAIEITVTRRLNGRDEAERVTLSAVLSSFGTKELTELDNLAEGLQRYPVLLVKGLVTPMRHTIAWFESQFDCRIRKISFSPILLSWMVAMWTGITDDPMAKPVELMYAVPPIIKGLSYITMTIQQEDAAKLWKCIHNEDADEVLSEEVADFLRSLEAHFFHHFKIHLSAMTLKRIGTPLAFVGNEGRLKIMMASGVRTVLHHLTELALENTGLKLY